MFQKLNKLVKNFSVDNNIQSTIEILELPKEFKSLLELVENDPPTNFRRDILILAPTKKLLTYQETKFLFVFRVLEEPKMYFNDNIQGKFFRKDFDI